MYLNTIILVMARVNLIEIVSLTIKSLNQKHTRISIFVLFYLTKLSLSLALNENKFILTLEFYFIYQT